MRKTLITTVAALATLPVGTSTVLAEDLPISANISIVTDYAFRGFSQTDQRPALQGGLDYEVGANYGIMEGLTPDAH
ncbi:TorF family putative porin [Rhodocyclaceae bacterium SMB388]